MKTIALVFLSLFLTKSCQQKKDATVSEEVKQTVETTKPEVIENKVQIGTKVEYEALSRGYYNKTIFENNQITVISDRNSGGKGEIIVLSKQDIIEITNLIEAVNLNELPNLKSPTEKRMYDGAPHANLTITSNATIYTGAGFDAGNPPFAIAKLVTKLVSYSEKK